jgi:hypothetical protein
MLLSLMSFLLSISSIRPATGVALSLGTGLTYLAEPGSSKDGYTLGSVPIELDLLHHRGAQWYSAGVSWMYGSSTVTGSRPAKAHILGLHLDVAQSILSYDYADIKLGGGAVVRYATVDLGAWNDGSVGSSSVIPPESRHQFLSTVRVFPSLLLHGSGGGGGIEVVPLRIEYGPSLFQIAPSVSYCMLF